MTIIGSWEGAHGIVHAVVLDPMCNEEDPRGWGKRCTLARIRGTQRVVLKEPWPAVTCILCLAEKAGAGQTNRG